MATKIKIVGDVHEKIEQYMEMYGHLSQVIQLGDWGFGDLHLKRPLNHLTIFGNHDNYDHLAAVNSLGDYAVDTANSIFTIRGAKSIDKDYHFLNGNPWDSREQLTHQQFAEDVMPQYEAVEPKIVLSHQCPSSIVKMILQERKEHRGVLSSITNTAMQIMLERHQPEMWIFGHQHFGFDRVVNGTRFVCLPELESFDLEIQHELKLERTLLK